MRNIKKNTTILIDFSKKFSKPIYERRIWPQIHLHVFTSGCRIVYPNLFPLKQTEIIKLGIQQHQETYYTYYLSLIRK